MKTWSILVADNKLDFVNTRSDFLEGEGYRVYRAYSAEEAYHSLSEFNVHLALVDIRLVDDDDERDTSGLTLAKDPAYHSIPKIMLTGFPTYEAVKEALGPSVDGLPPAVDFLGKAEGPEAMVKAVERALKEHVCINWDLQITGDLEQPPPFRALVSLLQPDLPIELLAHREGELEDLFRRLFRDYERLRIGQVLWHDGERLCLPMLVRSRQEVVHSRILVCGEPEALRHEAELIGELAPTGEQDSRLIGTEETMRFGALLYDLPNTDAYSVQPLKELVTGGGRGPAKAALLSLLRTIRSWHDQGQSTQSGDDLMDLYRQRVGLGQDGLPRSEVERRVAALVQAVRPLTATEIELDDKRLTFHLPGPRTLACPNPVAGAYGVPGWQRGPVVCKVSPGLLTFENILVDAQQRTWLSDFSRAGQAPQWWDYVCLEAGIRFDLSQAPDMLAWQDLEECLVAPAGLHGRLRAGDVQQRDLQGSATLIQEIRQEAGAETGSDVLPYYAGLLAWAVGAMAQYSPGTLYTRAELMRGAHLLLASGMIARRIDELVRERSQAESSEDAEARPEGADTLSLEEDGVTVRIGPEHRVHLSGQELALFRCLYKDAGQVVPRQALVEKVFGEEYDSLDKYQERRLNSLVRRLREKIEPIPGKSRYIHSVRRQGYRLEAAGQEKD